METEGTVAENEASGRQLLPWESMERVAPEETHFKSITIAAWSLGPLSLPTAGSPQS